jgi:hypothetical protein
MAAALRRSISIWPLVSSRGLLFNFARALQADLHAMVKNGAWYRNRDHSADTDHRLFLDHYALGLDQANSGWPPAALEAGSKCRKLLGCAQGASATEGAILLKVLTLLFLMSIYLKFKHGSKQ